MSDGACRSCGRKPSAYQVSVQICSQEAYVDPGQWVYAYREGFVQIGLCDQCFRAEKFEGLTPAEIDYFRENFHDTAVNGDDA